jgi:hypothetical protein
MVQYVGEGFFLLGTTSGVNELDILYTDDPNFVLQGLSGTLGGPLLFNEVWRIKRVPQKEVVGAGRRECP